MDELTTGRHARTAHIFSWFSPFYFPRKIRVSVCKIWTDSASPSPPLMRYYKLSWSGYWSVIWFSQFICLSQIRLVWSAPGHLYFHAPLILSCQDLFDLLAKAWFSLNVLDLNSIDGFLSSHKGASQVFQHQEVRRLVWRQNSFKKNIEVFICQEHLIFLHHHITIS